MPETEIHIRFSGVRGGDRLTASYCKDYLFINLEGPQDTDLRNMPSVTFANPTREDCQSLMAAVAKYLAELDAPAPEAAERAIDAAVGAISGVDAPQ